MKRKEAGLQALDICKLIQKLCMLRELMISHLIVVDSEKSSTEALLSFGVLTQVYALFSSSMQRWTILKKNVSRSLKSQSATGWESRIHCISPSRYHLADVVKALKEQESYSFEEKDNQTANNVRALVVRIES